MHYTCVTLLRGLAMKSLSKTAQIIRHIFIATVITAIGCVGAHQNLTPPRVALADLRIKEIKVFESVFEIEVRVFNTNDIAFEVKGIDCELVINDQRFATGVSKTQSSIPALASVTIPVTVYSSMLDIIRGLHDSHNAENLNYTIKGRLHLQGLGATTRTVPFKSSGELSLKGIDNLDETEM